MSLRRNSLYNIVGYLLPMVVSLVTIPVYIEWIGTSRYGVLAVLWLLLGYFGLADLGLGQAVAQRIAAARHRPREELASIYWTALSVSAALGLLGGMIMWLVASYFFGTVFSAEDWLRGEVVSVLPWLVIALPVLVMSGVLSGSLRGQERFLQLNLITVVGSALLQLLPLAAVPLWGVGLAVVVPAAIVARLLIFVALFVTSSRLLAVGSGPQFCRYQAAGLLRFGGWITVSSIIGPMMVILDRFVIGAVSGAKAVSYYTVPFQLANRTLIFSNAITSALLPRLAYASGQKSDALVKSSAAALLAASTPLVTACLLFVHPFLSWWISAEFARNAQVGAQLLLVGFWVNGLARLPLVILHARNQPRVVALSHVGELLPYLTLLYMGLHWYGLPGAAAAFALRVLADFLLLAFFSGHWRALLSPLTVPAMLVVSALTLSVAVVEPGFLWSFMVVTNLLLAMLWCWHAAPASMREMLDVRARIFRSVKDQ